MWKQWARAPLAVKKVYGMPPEALKPWMYTHLDSRAASALEGHVHGWRRGARLRELDQRFPDKVAGDRMGEAMVETLGLTIMKNETMEAIEICVYPSSDGRD